VVDRFGGVEPAGNCSNSSVVQGAGAASRKNTY
jgi:hypothetical protein